jgi:hypothetical protein
LTNKITTIAPGIATSTLSSSSEPRPRSRGSRGALRRARRGAGACAWREAGR